MSLRGSNHSRVRAAGGLLACASVLGGQLALATAARARQPQDPDASAGVFTRVCGTCHTPDRIVGTRRSRDQWEQVVEAMKAKGAKVADEEFPTIVDYLVGRYGRVNVNTATAEGVVEVLHITGEDAERIVTYRRSHGRFEDFDALAKVPGVDTAALKRVREAISF